jgi:hypothetical protein
MEFMKLFLLISAFIACANARGDLAVTPSKMGKAYEMKAWKSPKLQVYAHHPGGNK